MSRTLGRVGLLLAVGVALTTAQLGPPYAYGAYPYGYPPVYQAGMYGMGFGGYPYGGYGYGGYGGYGYDDRRYGGYGDRRPGRDDDRQDDRDDDPYGYNDYGSVPYSNSLNSMLDGFTNTQDLNRNGIPDHLEFTKSKIDDYLAKTQQLGSRKLSVQVDYLNSPLEYQYLNQYHGFQHPLAGTALGDYFNVPKPAPPPQSFQPVFGQGGMLVQPSTFTQPTGNATRT